MTRRASLGTGFWVLTAVLALLVAPWVWGSGLGRSVISQVGVAVIVCLSYNVLLGQSGLLSFGHAVFFGAGAFAAIHALRGVAPLPVSLIPLAAGVVALLVAVPLGWLSTRRGGLAFAMITLGLGELIWTGAQMFPALFGGEGGLSANRVTGAGLFGITFGPAIELYYLIAAYTLVCALLLYGLRSTPLGRLLNAVRDNAGRLGFLGYDARTVRFLAVLIAAFFAGVAGGLSALLFETVGSEVFSTQRSAAYLLFTVLGGAGFFMGPVIGAVLMVLSQVLLSELTPAWPLYVGLAFLAVVMFAPGGLAALLDVWRRPSHRSLAMGYLSLLVCLGVSAVGVAAMVELAYQRQLDSAAGAVPFLGAMLDVGSSDSWVGAVLAALTGAGLFISVRRQLSRSIGEQAA